MSSFSAHALRSSSGVLYVHGGQGHGEALLGDLVSVSPGGRHVSAVRCRGGPRLSHHAGCILADRHLVLVGGWDGKARTASVWMFDLEAAEWERLSLVSTKSSSLPPVGLSSHTATPVGDDTIVVVGREGGVRVQRRFGDVFLLRVDVASKTCHFEEAPFKVASRSGHTAVVLASYSSSRPALFVFGGRQDNPVQKIEFPSSAGLDVRLTTASDGFSRLSPLMSRVCDSASDVASMSEMKVGLRHHAALQLSADAFLVHGGEHFKARENVSGKSLIRIFGSVLLISWLLLQISYTSPGSAPRDP